MTYFNRNHENWAAVADKVVGDTVQLVVQPRHYDGGDEFLAEGTITKATAATRCFTMDGAQREGEIQNRANMKRLRIWIA